LKKRVNADSPSEPLCGTFAGWLRTNAFDVHPQILIVPEENFGRTQYQPVLFRFCPC
jgi:hypothetical protein